MEMAWLSEEVATTIGSGNVPITLDSGSSLPRLQYPQAIGMSVGRTPGEGKLEKLTSAEIRKAVEFFWSTFLAKSEEQLNSYYAPGSTVFQVAMGRSEP